MNADAKETAFQQDIISQMLEGGWQLGDPASYKRELALYTSDCLDYVKTTQPKTWAKYQQLYPNNPAPTHPCARGISASLHVIDLRDWNPHQALLEIVS